MALDTRLSELVDDRLHAAYWEGVQHYGTTDLVLIYEAERKRDPLGVMPREQLVSNPDAPEELRALSKPASEMAGDLKGATTAYWFVLLLEEEILWGAVNAVRISGGGSA